MKIKDITDRYISQRLFFKNFDEEIHKKKVLIVGIGGLGSWLAEFLARIGVEEIRLIDYDKVELKNLHRQNFTEKDIGRYKVDVMEERIKEINPNITVKKYLEINKDAFNGIDIFFDGTDNIESKYLLNEISVKYEIPYIFGSIVENHGFVGLINPNDFCFYDIYKGRTDVLRCTTHGVDPSAVFFASSLMLNLFIDFIKGERDGKIFYFNLSKKILEKINVKRKECEICVKKEFKYIKW